ncbi:MAG: hypothetical protein SFT68_04575 [Rickettsiaceae bacterium]|nr:hypothetical protein [Rickettsiaceae bacterium]
MKLFTCSLIILTLSSCSVGALYKNNSNTAPATKESHQNTDLETPPHYKLNSINHNK